jgi:hypothetical protein
MVSASRSVPHLNIRELLPSQAAFARALDPQSGLDPFVVTRRLVTRSDLPLDEVNELLSGLVLTECALHSRYYLSGGRYYAACARDIVRDVVCVDRGTDLSTDQVLSTGISARLSARESGAGRVTIDMTIAHWVCDDAGVDILENAIVDTLKHQEVRHLPVLRTAYDSLHATQRASSNSHREWLHDHAPILRSSYIPTRSTCDDLCQSDYCRSVQSELTTTVPPESMGYLRDLAASLRMQPSAIAFAAFCRVVAEHHDLPAVVVVTLFADRWDDTSRVVASLVNPRPVCIEDPMAHPRRYLRRTQHALLEAALRGYLEDYDSWFAATLGDSADRNVRLSFNFVGRWNDLAPGLVEAPRADGGRSLHQAWWYSDERTTISTLAPRCCAGGDELEGLLERQLTLIAEWRADLC